MYMYDVLQNQMNADGSNDGDVLTIFLLENR